jgi:hypothetical protein
VWIRHRPDGITEVSPPMAPREAFDRWLVIASAVLGTGAFFVAGLMPAAVFALLVAAFLAGEVVLGLRALLLALLRPLADVHEVPRPPLRRPAR